MNKNIKSNKVPDHEDTYSYSSIRNFIHRARLNSIKQICKNHFKNNSSYADFGCSNGFVTNQIINDNNFSYAIGYDFIPELIEEGNSRFNFQILHLDLNEGKSPGKFDNVSCFETLEHVTNMDQSIKTIIDSINDNGRGIISVPIEIGFIGVLKYLIKIIVFRYSLEELTGKNIFWSYLISLLKNERISRYRVLHGNKEWCWHFGFDYRDIRDVLNKNNVKFIEKTKGSTAIYLIENKI